MTKVNIYLDDTRLPIEPNYFDWVAVSSYEELVSKVEEIGFENIGIISLDHDLGDSAMQEYFQNTKFTGDINYNNITEKTGYDCAKWLSENWLNGKPLFRVYTHSHNPTGRENIMSIINNTYKHLNSEFECRKSTIPFKNKD